MQWLWYINTLTWLLLIKTVNSLKLNEWKRHKHAHDKNRYNEKYSILKFSLSVLLFLKIIVSSCIDA